MRNTPLFITLLASLTAAASGCAQTECAPGTIERDGRCEPSTADVDPGKCGPGTELQGNICVPVVLPTHCDPTTTMEQVNDDGTITCIGTGGGDCSMAIACPTPTGNKVTICGQLYDFETNAKFVDPGGGSANCDLQNPTSSGPCALQILAYDAIAFGTNPTTAQQVAVDSVTIDKCGRYRVAGIDTNSISTFIGLGIDDGPPSPSGQPPMLGAGGVTVTVGVAAPKADGPVIKDFEAWIVNQSTTNKWATSGGPPLGTLGGGTGGIYAPVFRKHKKGNGDPLEPQPGVAVTLASNPIPNNDYYFTAAETTRMNVDGAATVTGANGTALVTNAAVSQSVEYRGSGGLGAGCIWGPHAGASLPGIVFIQVFRKIDAFGQTCAD